MSSLQPAQQLDSGGKENVVDVDDLNLNVEKSDNLKDPDSVIIQRLIISVIRTILLSENIRTFIPGHGNTFESRQYHNRSVSARFDKHGSPSNQVEIAKSKSINSQKDTGGEFTV